MSVSIIPTGTLASVSQYVARWVTEGKFEGETKDARENPLKVMQLMASDVCASLGINVEGRKEGEVAAAVYGALKEENIAKFRSAYPDFDDVATTQRTALTAADFSGDDYRISHDEAGGAYLMSALDTLSHGLEDGKPSRLVRVFESIRKLSGHLVHACVAGNMPRPSAAEVAESLVRLKAHGHFVVEAQSGIDGLMDRLMVDTQHGWHTGRDVFMHIYANADAHAESLMLPSDSDNFRLSSPRMTLSDVSRNAPVHYALSGDIPVPEKTAVNQLIEAARFTQRYLEWLQPDALLHVDGKPFSEEERKALRGSLIDLTNDLLISGQRNRCVYDGTLPARAAFEQQQAYRKDDKVLYLVGDVDPTSPVEVPASPDINERQQALLGLIRQPGVHVLTDQSEVDKLGPAMTEGMLQFNVSSHDLSALASRLVRPVDATTLRLIDILDVAESEHHVFSSPSLSVDERMTHIASALKANGFADSSAFMERARSNLEERMADTPELLVHHAYSVLPDSEKVAMENQAPETLSSTLERLEAQGDALPAPKRR